MATDIVNHLKPLYLVSVFKKMTTSCGFYRFHCMNPINVKNVIVEPIVQAPNIIASYNDLLIAITFFIKMSKSHW